MLYATWRGGLVRHLAEHAGGVWLPNTVLDLVVGYCIEGQDKLMRTLKRLTNGFPTDFKSEKPWPVIEAPLVSVIRVSNHCIISPQNDTVLTLVMCA